MYIYIYILHNIYIYTYIYIYYVFLFLLLFMYFDHVINIRIYIYIFIYTYYMYMYMCMCVCTVFCWSNVDLNSITCILPFSACEDIAMGFQRWQPRPLPLNTTYMLPKMNRPNEPGFIWVVFNVRWNMVEWIYGETTGLFEYVWQTCLILIQISTARPCPSSSSSSSSSTIKNHQYH